MSKYVIRVGITILAATLLSAGFSPAIAQSSNSIPWTNTFEGYSAGYLITDDSAWYGASSNSSAIITVPDHGLQGGYVYGEPHTQVLQVNDALTNFYDMQFNDFIYVDMLVNLPHVNEPSFSIFLNNLEYYPHRYALPSITMYVNELGELVFRHSYYDDQSAAPWGYEKIWTTNSTVNLGSNEWHRLSFTIEPKTGMDYFDIYFSLQIDGGEALTNSLGYADTSNNFEPDGGPWFMAVNLPGAFYGNRGKFSAISFNEGVMVDDLVVSTNPPGPPPPVFIRATDGATDVTHLSATLRASITYQSVPEVGTWIYWGTNDMGTTTTGWDNAAFYGSNSLPVPVSLSTNVSGLTPYTDYYYRFAAGTNDTLGWTEPATFKTLGLPVLSNSAPGWIDTEWASVNCVMLKGTEADVRVYIGLVDGGTNAGVWDRALGGIMSNGNLPGAFDVDPGVTYYYRYYAANSAGSAWAPESGTFTTPLDSSNVVYVDKEATGLKNGTSWPHAFSRIQDGLDAAGDGFSVVVRNGHYLLDAGLVIDNALTLHGEFAEPVSTVNGDDQFRCIEVLNSNAVIDTMVMRNGFARGEGTGINATNGCTVRNCLLVYNDCYYDWNKDTTPGARSGGALYFGSGGLVENCTIRDNSGHQTGSAIYMGNGGQIDNCVIRDNVSEEGSPVYLQLNGICRSSEILSNQGGQCGGINLGSSGQVIDTLAKNNYGYGNGGGFALGQGSIVSNCVVTDNYASDGGGGINCGGGLVIDSVVSSNYTQWNARGGGVRCTASGTVENCSVFANEVRDGNGGGIYGHQSTIRNCTVWNNTADEDDDDWGDGGGIYATYSLVTGCTVISNSADEDGDGIFAYESTVSDCLVVSNFQCGVYAEQSVIENCIITRNVDGIEADSSTIRNCSVVYNDMADDDDGNRGVILRSNSQILNSIVYFNDSDYDDQNFKSNGTNSSVANSCITPDPGGISNVTSAPLFINAAAYDFRLQPGSPCIDAGTAITNLITDFDGYARPNDGDDSGVAEWDIGAFEYPHMYPQGGAEIRTRRPTFTWPDTGKEWTELYISRNGTNYMSVWVQSNNSWTAESDFHGGNFKWWVRTWESGVGLSPWSGTAHFVIPFWPPATPIQLWPAGSIPKGDIPYAWIGNTNATRYQVYIKRNSTGNWTQWYDTGAVSGRVIQVIAGHTPNTLYEWWVRGQNRDGESEWSEGMWFRTPDPFPATTHYVWTNGTAIWPYTNWIQAANDIQTAVDAAHDSDTVLVTNDFYGTSSRIAEPGDVWSTLVVTNDVHVQSTGWRSVIQIGGTQDFTRCVYMSDGMLSGFELYGGQLMDWTNANRGAAIYATGGVVSNCYIGGGLARYGGAIYGGTVIDSVIANGTAWAGGGAYSSIVVNCELRDNRGELYGGALYGCKATDCLIRENAAPHGDAAYESTLYNCTIVSNMTTATDSSALANCAATNCTIAYNGGGVEGGSAVNSLIARNNGWGAVDSKVAYSTVVSNMLGGTLDCHVFGSIVYYNDYFGGGITNNCYSCFRMSSCVWPYSTGTAQQPGNTTNAPMFKDPDSNDWRLKYGSPCIDGIVLQTSLRVWDDLDGRTRPIDGDGMWAPTNDMGCYEYDYANDDSDGDTLADKTEVEMAGMNPLKPDDDDDGIPTSIEVDWNSTPGYQAGSDLNPASWDSDNDNVSDIIEVATGNSALDDQSAGSLAISAPLTFDSRGRALLEWPIFDTYRSFNISYYVERTTNMQDWLSVGGYVADGDTVRDLRFTDRFGSPEFACYRLRLSMFQDPDPLPITLTVTNELGTFGLSGYLLYNGPLTNGAIVAGSVVITGTGSPFPFTDNGDGTLSGQLGTDGTIAYDIGAWAIDLKTLAAAEGTPIHISYQHTIYQGPIYPPPEVAKGESIGIGNSDYDRYAGVLSNRNIVGSSLGITAGGYSFMDNGSGILLGTISGTTGSISYDTGAWSLQLLAGLSDGTSLTANYSYLFEYPPASSFRGEVLGLGNGTFTVYSGNLATNTIETGTVVIVAGPLLFEDRGDGTLDGTDTMTGTIDYNTGDWLIDLQTTPLGTGESIRAWYDYR